MKRGHHLRFHRRHGIGEFFERDAGVSCARRGETRFGVTGRWGNRMRANAISTMTESRIVISNRRVSRETRDLGDPAGMRASYRRPPAGRKVSVPSRASEDFALPDGGQHQVVVPVEHDVASADHVPPTQCEVPESPAARQSLRSDGSAGGRSRPGAVQYRNRWASARPATKMRGVSVCVTCSHPPVAAASAPAVSKVLRMILAASRV